MTRQQYEAAVSIQGYLRELTKKLSKEFFFVIKGLQARLSETIEEFDQTLARLISGWTLSTLPASLLRRSSIGIWLSWMEVLDKEMVCLLSATSWPTRRSMMKALW